MNRAVVVFSGGQDSTTCLVKAIKEFDEVHALTFDYGQRHRTELKVAQTLCQQLGINFHHVLDLNVLNTLAPSALTRASIPVSDELTQAGLPSTFVPGRNITFLTFAAIYAYQVDAQALITGVCETDFSGYPDCRHEFVQALEKALVLGMDRPLEIITPLMWLDKAQTWALADRYDALDLIQYQTLTCYNGIIGEGCQTCAACDLRSKGLNLYLADKAKFQAQLDQITPPI